MVPQDLPGSPVSEIRSINDLDLMVTAPSGSTVWMGNGVAGGDRHNNNERVSGCVGGSGGFCLSGGCKVFLGVRNCPEWLSKSNVSLGNP